MNTSLPTIYFCGDVHGSFEHVLATAQRDRPDALIFLGDLEAQWPLEVSLAPIIGETEVYWVHGNHDTDNQLNFDNVFGSELGSRNLHGRVVEVCGMRIAGLGGVFRGKVWVPPAAPLFQSYGEFVEDLTSLHPPHYAATQVGKSSRRELTHMSTIFPNIYEQLLHLQADVLVTHEAPSCHPKGFRAIDSLAAALGVRHAFHGHHHDRLDYSKDWDRLGFKAYGVGFCGITDLAGRVVAPGDFDDNAAQVDV